MKSYLIKKGNHYASGLHLGVHFGITEQKYKVRFSKECIYTPDEENDWNKLCGWSYGLHHKNSIRICWRPQVVDGLDFGAHITGKIELCIYVYENSVRKTSAQTLTVDVEKDVYLYLGLDTWDKYVDMQVDVWNEEGTDYALQEAIHLKYNIKPSWGYRLYPYIGGDNVAMQDTRIYLERL